MSKPNTITWLYMAAKKGDKVQTWGIENLGDGSYRTHEGFTNGKISISAPTFCEAKNLGKKNETNPISQCAIEVAAKIQKKKDKGYSADPDKIERPFVPTLAKVYKDHKKKVIFPCYVQPKLDGARAFLTKDGLFSRERNEFKSAPHIRAQFDNFFLENPEAIIDGELYSRKEKGKDAVNFNEIMSLIKQQKPTREDLKKSEENIEYHIFDTVLNEPFIDRLNSCTVLFGKYKYIQIVPAYRVENESEIESWHGVFANQGYEGAMVRWGQEGYILERTDKLLKFKKMQDAEFKIVDILDGRGKRANCCAKWSLETADGKPFEAGPTGSDAENKEYFDNKHKYVGKMATICFQELTPDGVPRFGVFKAVRDMD